MGSHYITGEHISKQSHLIKIPHVSADAPQLLFGLNLMTFSHVQEKILKSYRPPSNHAKC